MIVIIHIFARIVAFKKKWGAAENPATLHALLRIKKTFTTVEKEI